MRPVAAAASKRAPDSSYAITPDEAGSLAGLFGERVRRTPDATAYRYYEVAAGAWRDLSWSDMAARVARWRSALAEEALDPGTPVAILLPNGPDWAAVDQAVQSLGLVTVGLFRGDTPGNAAYMLAHSQSRVLVAETFQQWLPVREALAGSAGDLRRVVSLAPLPAGAADDVVTEADAWLPVTAAATAPQEVDPDSVATLVYTSGSMGRPKAVMLSHRNLLHNAYACFRAIPQYPDDVQLSLLPLAHAFERVTGYYHGMLVGSAIAFNRSVPQFQEDLLEVRPTILIAVPRVFERMYARIWREVGMSTGTSRGLFQLAVEVGWSRFLYRQGQGPWHSRHILGPMLEQMVARKVLDRFGGRLRVAVSGGAALSPRLARTFIGLGVPLLQGYGLTEASPVVSTNRLDDNEPASVGLPIENVAIKVAANNELLVKGPGVMLGYWRDEAATRRAIDGGGWLHTGDKISRLDQNRLYLTGRIKEIIVMSNGEKASPSDIESALRGHPLVDQVMVLGEARPFLSALVVCDPQALATLKDRLKLPETDEAERGRSGKPALERALLDIFAKELKDFPRHSQIRRVAVVDQPWTIEGGLLSPTMKPRRKVIGKRFAAQIERLYERHFHAEKTDFSRNVDVD